MKKVLIVDDEKNIILTLKMFFISKGFNVIIATDGLEAIYIVENNMPDLIMLDIVLPKLNGYLVCQALKESISTKEIPIIIMSAKTQESDIKRAFDVGADEYIVKPFTIDDIRLLVSKYI
jgi:DNA-binding response OmpR family regulator